MGISVLFVDDDKNLLSAISRVLTLEKEEIEFTLSDSAEEGLRLLDENHFDVVVSDYRMPGMDGLTFLSIVREKHPEIKRVVLSAQVRKNVYNEAETVAHRYITKPCDAESLIAEIEELTK